ncbi:MAG: SDR family oxidoreductase [Ancrocorticia populi]|uniref:NAD-dependent dehydratase n=2 Tax=Ancrocorticia populi TaxID=2175228 RepID=A0A2V1K973_9ACTO|nr:SDR family oxidoreductase [Ancrocorticia populi]PWF27322.1 NAD-dependent dehydratase [Ancrocorticia populi]
MGSEKRVVILGGHGKVALLAAPRLVDAGFSVDAVIRNPEHSSDVAETGGNPVVLDMEQASTEEFARLFEGAYAVVFSAGAGGGNPERTNAVDYEAASRAIDAAGEAGVNKFVMVSYATVNADLDRVDPSDSFYPYVRAKHDADAHLRASGLDYTILGPGMLTLEPATEKVTIADAAGKVDGAWPTQNNATSRANVAATIAYVIANGAATRQTVNFYDGDTPLAAALS